MTDINVDILIVGAGPAGLYAAYCAGFRGMRTAVIDSLPEAGGQITALYPEKRVYDVAGLPGVKGRELVAGLLEQCRTFEHTFLLGDQARTLQSGDQEGRFEVGTSAGRRIRCDAIVVTGGIGTFTPRPLPAAAGFSGAGISYFVPDPTQFTDLDVVIVGGGDSACDWALTLEPLARSVTLVHRREQFRAHEHTVALMRESSVDVRTCANVGRILGEGAVEAVEIVDISGNTIETIKAQGVIAALGFVANLGPLLTWGIETRDRRIVVDTHMSTSVHGIFAAGDITQYPGKVRLISVGFGEAATAVNNAAVLLDPTLDLFPGHSTDAV